MNIQAGLEALHDLVALTRLSPESAIPQDIGVADLVLTDGALLRIAGTQRVQVLRDGHWINLLLLLVGFPGEMGPPRDPAIPEIDHLEDVVYLVLARHATNLECAAWTADVPPAEFPLRALEILQIESRVGNQVTLARTQNIHRFVAHY